MPAPFLMDFPTDLIIFIIFSKGRGFSRFESRHNDLREGEMMRKIFLITSFLVFVLPVLPVHRYGIR